MIGDWRNCWEELQASFDEIEEIYAGRRAGSNDAFHDLKSFFERSESLRDHAILALGEPKKTGQIDVGMRASTALSIAHDVAIMVKHGKQDETPWSGGAELVSQSVNVTPETASFRATVPTPGVDETSSSPAAAATSAHRWRIRHAPPSQPSVDLDALDVCRDVVAAWKQLLRSANLVT